MILVMILVKSFKSNGKLIEVFKVREHYEIHIDKEFYCSSDSLKEVDEELKSI